MKKLIYSLFALLIAFNAMAVTTIYSENFNAATTPGLPTGWTSVKLDGQTLNTNAAVPTQADAWNTAGTTNKFPYSQSYFVSPTVPANRWLISPTITIPPTGEIYLQWFSVCQYDGGAGFSDGYELYVSPTADTAVSSFTANVFSLPFDNATGGSHTINLNAYRGTTVRLAWRNNTTNGGYLILDDINMIVPDDRDAVAVSFSNLTTTMTGGTAINIGTNVFNNGSTIINSLEMSYSINGGAPVTATISGLNIPPFGSGVVTHTTPWTPANGTAYSVSMTIGQVNALADAVTTNNTISKSVFTFPSPIIARTPLYEIFTSSTCGPCVAGNANFHTIVDPKPVGEYVSIKYQQDFPGTGDPYATTESVNRRDYYNINSIPRMEIDGGWDGNAQSFTNTMYNDSRNVSAFADLSGTFARNDATKYFEININYTPRVNLSAGDAKLYVAVVEGLTTQNVKTNGETEFKQVMKKMIPDDNGTAIPATTSGTPLTFNTTYTFNGNFRLPTNGTAAQHINHTSENSIENIDDCYVVAWLQFEDGKVVLQAANLAKTFGASVNTPEVSNMEVAVYPNPAVNNANVSFNVVGEQELTVKIVDSKGQVVEQETGVYTTGKQDLTINTKDFANGAYTINVSGKNVNISKSLVVNH